MNREEKGKVVKKHSTAKIVWSIIGLLAAVFAIRMVLMGGVFGLLIWDYANTEVIEDTDVNHYLDYIGENAKEEYRTKMGMDETIFPTDITDNMDVKDYKMVYYNPWDPQWLSYLTVEYDAQDYQTETERLQAYDSTEYQGYYSVTGFDKGYELLAVYADPYYGFVYAVTDGEKEITYVELIFCNYFMDLEYEKYIDEKYLPSGFDATSDNKYMNKMTNR